MNRTIQILTALLAAAAPASAWALGDAGSYGSSSGAQDDGPPLAFGRKLDVGGYGGIDVAYTRMFGRDGASISANGIA